MKRIVWVLFVVSACASPTAPDCTPQLRVRTGTTGSTPLVPEGCPKVEWHLKEEGEGGGRRR